MRTRCMLSMLPLALLLVMGCGGNDLDYDIADATGTVTYKGAPVAGASVSFVYEGGTTAVGVTDDQGHFTMMTSGYEGAPVGSAQVVIAKTSDAMAEEGGDASWEDMMKMTEKAGENMKGMAPENALPLKYSSPSTSGLTADVKEGEENTFEWDLED